MSYKTTLLLFITFLSTSKIFPGNGKHTNQKRKRTAHNMKPDQRPDRNSSAPYDDVKKAHEVQRREEQRMVATFFAKRDRKHGRRSGGQWYITPSAMPEELARRERESEEKRAPTIPYEKKYTGISFGDIKLYNETLSLTSQMALQEKMERRRQIDKLKRK